MRSLTKSLVSFLKKEDGPTAVEYAVMLALIIVVCIAAITTLGCNANRRSASSARPSSRREHHRWLGSRPRLRSLLAGRAVNGSARVVVGGLRRPRLTDTDSLTRLASEVTNRWLQTSRLSTAIQPAATNAPTAPRLPPTTRSGIDRAFVDPDGPDAAPRPAVGRSPQSSPTRSGPRSRRPGSTPGPLVVVCVGMILAAFIDGWALKVPNWVTLPLVLSGWMLGLLPRLRRRASTAGTGGFGMAFLGTVLGLRSSCSRCS